MTVKVGPKQEVITSRQIPLQPRELILNESRTGQTWGSFISGNYVSQAISATLRSAGFTVTVGGEYYATKVPENTTMLNAVYNRNSVWDMTNEYRKRTVDNWTIINNQSDGGDDAANNATSPLKAAGYKMYYNTGVGSHDRNYRLNTNTTVRATKLMQYLLEKSPKGYLTAITTQNDNRPAGVFWRDDISGYTIISELPSTAVPMIIDGGGRCTTFIDLTNRFFWMGESEHFGEHCELDQQKLCDNICDFLVKAAQYGTAFTDLLVEEGTDLGDGRKAQPAPWHEYWNGTANGGTDNRLKPAAGY
jgi:hypothetical protein